MVRNITAGVLGCMMVFIITLQHPVLGFCDCSKTFFLLDCACNESDQVSDTAPVSTPACEHGCCHHEDATENEIDPVAEPEPCNDCKELFSLEDLAFVWSADHFSSQEDEQPAPGHFVASGVVNRHSIQSELLWALEPPPDRMTRSMLPIY